MAATAQASPACCLLRRAFALSFGDRERSDDSRGQALSLTREGGNTVIGQAPVQRAEVQQMIVGRLSPSSRRDTRGLAAKGG